MEHDFLSEQSISCLPDGYFARSDGIYQSKINKEGEVESIWLCSPITVIARVRKLDSTGWGRLIRLTDPDSHEHELTIPDSRASAKVITALRDRGLRIASDAASKRAFIHLLESWAPRCPSKIVTEKLGWIDGEFSSFALGSTKVLGEREVIHSASQISTVSAAMIEQGTLDAWRSTVAAPCAGNPLLILGISLAFSGPLLEPLGVQGGGLHLCGMSSSGKSTIQNVAASVWGSPAFSCSWRATVNGLEGVAAACNSTLLILDEIGECGSKDVGSATYMLAHGIGKQRSDSMGNAIPPATWRLSMLSSGELTLAEKILEDGQKIKAGQEVRLIDIVADNRRHGAFDDTHGDSGQVFADKMNNAATANYGLAGPAFAEWIVRHRERIIPILKRTMTNYEDLMRHDFGPQLDGVSGRAMTRFALIAAAGAAATTH